MTRGRKPIPKPTGEPIGPQDIQPPAHLDQAALAEWRRAVAELAGLGTLHTADRNVIAAHAQAVARWAEAESRLRELGLVVKSPNGFPQMNPFLPIANRAMEQLLKTASELGLTPTARARLAGKTKPAAKAKAADQPDNPLTRLRIAR